MPHTVLTRILIVAASLSLLPVCAVHGAPPDNPGGGNGGGGNGGGGRKAAPYAIIPFLPDQAIDSSEITDLNEGTGVVGYGELPNDAGFLAAHYDLESGDTTLLEGGSAIAYGINDLNQIVGLVEVDGVAEAAFWSDQFADPIPLDLPADDVHGIAFDINDDGFVVGYFYPTTAGATTMQTAVAWRVVVDEAEVAHVDGPVILPPLPGDTFSYARRVNEFFEGVAQTAGHSHAAPADSGFESREAVLWSLTLDEDGLLETPAAPEALGKLGLLDPSDSGSEGLSDVGDVVGASDGFPFIAQTGGFAEPLPLPRNTQEGRAYDVNNLGHVVGRLDIYKLKGFVEGPGNNHPYLWKDGEMIDLEQQVDLGDWDILSGATQINDAGIIAGYGWYDLKRRGFLMIPNAP